MRAINEGDPETLDRIAGAIRGRSTRVCHVVASEMDNYEPCMYTDRVLEAVKVLRDQGKEAASCFASSYLLKKLLFIFLLICLYLFITHPEYVICNNPSDIVVYFCFVFVRKCYINQWTVILFHPTFAVLPNFAQRVDVAVEALSSTPGKEVDENEFIDASHLVYDGVREIRMAVLMNKADDELDPDDVLMDDYHGIEIRSKCKFFFFFSFMNILIN